MNLRLDAQGRRVREGEQVLIGGNERYRADLSELFLQRVRRPGAIHIARRTEPTFDWSATCYF
jgi:hypothetical protein